MDVRVPAGEFPNVAASRIGSRLPSSALNVGSANGRPIS